MTQWKNTFGGDIFEENNKTKTRLFPEPDSKMVPGNEPRTAENNNFKRYIELCVVCEWKKKQ